VLPRDCDSASSRSSPGPRIVPSWFLSHGYSGSRKKSLARYFSIGQSGCLSACISHRLRFRHRLRFSRQPPPGPAGWFRLVAKTRHAVADNGDAVAKTGNAVTALGSHLPDLAACDRRMVTRVPKVVTRVRKMVTRSPNMVTRYPQLVRKSPNPLDLPATTPGPYPKWVTTSETRGSTRPGGSMAPALAGRCVFRNRKCTL